MKHSHLDITQAILIEGSRRDASQASLRLALYDERGNPLTPGIGDSAYRLEADQIYTEADGIVPAGTVESIFEAGSGTWDVSEGSSPFARRWGHNVTFGEGDPTGKTFENRSYPVLTYTPPSGQTPYGALGTVFLKLPIAWFPNWPLVQKHNETSLKDITNALPPGVVMQWEASTTNDEHGVVDAVPAWGNNNEDMFGLVLSKFGGTLEDAAFQPDDQLSIYPGFNLSGLGRLNLPADAAL